MKGLRVAAIYLGIAWAIAGAAGLWTAFAGSAALSAQKDRISADTQEKVEAVEKRKAELTDKHDGKIANAEKKLKDEEETLAGIDAEQQKKKHASQEDRVAKAKAAVDAAKETKTKALAEADKDIEDLRADETAQHETLEKMDAGAGASWWRALIGLAVALGFIVLGVILPTGRGGPSRASGRSTVPYDDEVVAKLGDVGDHPDGPSEMGPGGDTAVDLRAMKGPGPDKD